MKHVAALLCYVQHSGAIGTRQHVRKDKHEKATTISFHARHFVRAPNKVPNMEQNCSSLFMFVFPEVSCKELPLLGIQMPWQEKHEQVVFAAYVQL